MLLLTTSSHKTAMKWEHPNHGRLMVPRCYDRATDTAYRGVPWAVDNDGFNGFNAPAWQRMIMNLAGLHGCLFVNAPDVFDQVRGIGDHDATLKMWRQWYPFLALTGFPLSFVLQNGATIATVPWDELDAVFIGGCTTWKLGPEAEALTAEAKHRGKWVHMGRVNSERRIAYARSIGCDSVDGTGWAKFRDAMLPRGLRALSPPRTYRPDWNPRHDHHEPATPTTTHPATARHPRPRRRHERRRQDRRGIRHPPHRPRTPRGLPRRPGSVRPRPTIRVGDRDMIARAVLLSPRRKERNVVHGRHERRIGTDSVAFHATDGRELHAAACGLTEGACLTIYLCRGWGQIPDVGDILRGLVASHAAHILDEWGRPMPDYARRPDVLPVLTDQGVQHMARCGA